MPMGERPKPAGSTFAPPPPPPGLAKRPASVAVAPPISPPDTEMAQVPRSNGYGNGGNYGNHNDGDDDDDEEDGVAEPPAIVGSWTFPMKGMFPAPRPFRDGRKTYGSGRATGGGVGFM